MNQNESNTDKTQAEQNPALTDLEVPTPDEIKGGTILLTHANTYQGTTRVDDGVSKDMWTSVVGNVDVHY